MIIPGLKQYCLFMGLSVGVLLWHGQLYGSNGYDLVTMKNGDIHLGAVAQERFTMESSYGRISVPYHLMAALTIGKDTEPDYLTTQLGDRFSGKLVDVRFPILRAIEATLSLNAADVDEIIFVPRPGLVRSIVAPDAIETSDGDRFLGEIQLGDLMLKTENALRLIHPKDVRWMDVASRMDADDIHVQLTFTEGGISQGQLLAPSGIPVMNRYGQLLNISLAELSQLSFGLMKPGDRPQFNYHPRENNARYLQDHLSDGSDGPLMVILPEGEYLRGNNEGDDDERPPVNIRLDSFAIGVYEITFDEYDRFCQQTRCASPADQMGAR